MKILVADDMYCDDIILQLQKNGFGGAEFVAVKTAEEAQSAIEGGLVPDLFICDQNFTRNVWVKKMKGTELIKGIRDERKMDFPIMLYTSDDSALQALRPEWGIVYCRFSLVETAKDLLARKKP